MARNKYYSDDENSKIILLLKNNKGKTYKEIARQAMSYGMFPGRSVDGIASQLSRIAKNANKSDASEEQLCIIPESERVTGKELRIKVLESRNEYLEKISEKYNKLIEVTLLEASKAGVGTYGPFVYIDYKRLARCLYQLEPGLFQEKINELISKEFEYASDS